MGNNWFKQDEEEFFCYMLRVAEGSDIMPDVGMIDKSLLKYSDLNSASELEDSITHALRGVGRKTPDYLQSLDSALSAFKKVSNAVGLGALAFSMVLEFTIGALEEEESGDSAVEMLRRVFAEEKASGVRDSMEEYMKRLGMQLNRQPTQALEETERLEKQLSEQLTRLKNSMLHDNQMSSRSMKHWTNGAAFHLQMLIHAARLKMQNTTGDEAQLQVHVASIISVLDRYQHDLRELIKQYKTYKKSTILVFQPSLYYPWVMTGYDWRVKDKELERETRTVYYRNEVLGSSDIYVFDNWSMLKKLSNYFSDLKDNVKELIVQNVEFDIEKVLNVSGK